jgi:hypothetical protein
MAYFYPTCTFVYPPAILDCDNFRRMNYLMIRLGSVMAGGGLIWAVARATNGLRLDDSPLQSAAGAVLAQRGLIELCALGILLWVVGKWRRYTTAHL